MSSMLLAQAVTNGLALGASYILMALGFTMIFGVLRIVNFAHGEFYMLSAFLVFVGMTQLELNYFVAAAAAIVVVAMLGIVAEEVLFRRFRDKEMEGMIAALGLSILMQNLSLIAWGPYDLSIPSIFSGVLRIGTFFYPTERIMVVLLSVVLMAAFYVFLKHTRAGLAIRAIAQDTEIAKAQGMRVQRLYPSAFAVGAALAGAAGAIIGPIFALNPWIGMMPMMKAFIVVILGGIGSLPGAFLGGLILGLAESFVSTYGGKAMADMLGFVLVIGILLFRPSGLLGQPQVTR
jgi:branched-chain amino acid transport system permease protein